MAESVQTKSVYQQLQDQKAAQTTAVTPASANIAPTATPTAETTPTPTPETAPVATPLTTTTPEVKGLTVPSGTDMDRQLGIYQSTALDQFNALEDAVISASEVEAQVNEVMQDLQIPEPPKLVDLYSELYNSTGMNNINERLTSLKTERDAIQNRLQARLKYTEGQVVGMDVISGQTSEIQRQEQMNLDYINRAISVTVEEQQSALGYINTIVSLTGQDYQNALTAYTTEFDSKMKAIQMINDAKETQFNQQMQINQQEFELKQWEQSVAQSQLAMYADLIGSGQLFYSNMSAEQKNSINALEMKAGLPVGFLSKVQLDPKNKVQSITTRQGSDGYVYSDVVSVDPKTGKVSVKSIKLGTFYRGSSGGGSGSSSTKNKYGYTTTQWNTKKTEALSYLKKWENDSNMEITGDKGDLVLSDAEFDSAAADFKSKYGDAGYELLINSLNQGCYQRYVPETGGKMKVVWK